MRLVVIGDSLSFHGPVGPLPLTDPRLYPNVLATALAEALDEPVEMQLAARAGWGVREVWLALQKDIHLQQQLLIDADAVVFGVGSIDSVSVGVPRGLLVGLPYVRPVGLRRRLRRFVDGHHQTLVRATGHRLRFTPLSVYRHGWRKSIEAVRLFSSSAPLVGVLPTLHRGDYYDASDRHHPQVRAVTLAMAAELQVPLVDLASLVRPHLAALNPDGLHWPFEMHADVGDAMATALLKQIQESS